MTKEKKKPIKYQTQVTYQLTFTYWTNCKMAKLFANSIAKAASTSGNFYT